MARMYKSTNVTTVGVKIVTCFNNGTESERRFKVGDTVENLRYIENEEIKFATGVIKNIGYQMNLPLTWNPDKPRDTIATDMTLTDLVIDASQSFGEDNIVIVPLREVVEWDEERNVKRMKFGPYVVCDMELKYTDYRVATAEVEIGDTFNNVRIMDLNNIGPDGDITGKFTVIGFAYESLQATDISFTGLALMNVDTQEVIVSDFKQILDLNEVYTYEIPDTSAIATVLRQLAPGDTIAIDNEIDTSDGNPLRVTQTDITVTLNENVICDGGSNSGVRVIGEGTLTLNGGGKVVTTNPYDGSHASGVIGVYNDGELIVDAGGIEAVIADDPVNKGQFGICCYNNAKVTINDGDFVAGWYCVTGNGSGTSADSTTTINGGKLLSVADFAIYHPHAGKLVINGGTISGAAGAVAVNNGSVEINGGVFTVLGGGDTGDWPDGTSGMPEACINLNAKYGNVTCKITGGEFRTKVADIPLVAVNRTKHGVVLEISGGIFDTEPDASWLAEGYESKLVYTTDGTEYHVVKK